MFLLPTEHTEDKACILFLFCILFKNSLKKKISRYLEPQFYLKIKFDANAKDGFPKHSENTT